ncbi:helix-turn-helix transcriptional regulator [Pedomonas mirosovicensis]|uniref:helix-turn-helix transcriptional regulator n=1 Tax=Pedomonas mirosovicensis TaxID=2908641 RepID=UPI0021673EB1|nr:AraC family transcriptional regulator [Pedomonas mirosovicensis]MCH8686624.1 AraC family transcriptional regulator [Pedomonas mirosovicensis]
MGMQSGTNYKDLGPLLTVTENWSAILRMMEARFQARLAVDPATSLDEYGILTHVEDGSNKDLLFGKNEFLKIDDEFFATVNTMSFAKDQPFAFIGEDWLRICWMIRGACDQELVPYGTSRVPSWVTPTTLRMRPAHVDFELQPDNFIKVERLKACGPMMWVSLALSRRALQRALGEMDSAIPRDLDRYIYRDDSLLLFRRSPISLAGMKILLSLFEVPLTGKLRVRFLRSQIQSLLYLSLGNEWDNSRDAQSSLAYRKVVEGAELLRMYARSSDFDIEAIAQQLGVSRSFFDKNFRMVYGVTPAKYLLDEKMKYAAELLQRGDMPIKEIAVHLGYGTNSSLTRSFHRWHGVSPIEFRTAHFRRSHLHQ